MLKNARRDQQKVTKYGNTAIIYSYPPNAPRYKTVTQTIKKTSLPVRPDLRGEQPRSEEVAIIAPGCHNCGRDYPLNNCLCIACQGTNPDHFVNWVASKSGLSWKYRGCATLQIDRVFPETEERKWLPTSRHERKRGTSTSVLVTDCLPTTGGLKTVAAQHMSSRRKSEVVTTMVPTALARPTAFAQCIVMRVGHASNLQADDVDASIDSMPLIVLA